MPRTSRGAAASGRCRECQAEYEREKRGRGKVQHRRTTAAWERLRRAVLARDGACVRCGSHDDLTVHLDPRLGGRHDLGTLETCATLCRSCHGSVDAPRAHRSWAL